ncbi:MAG: hypothetical protein NTU47_00785 [Ignavibacteriales bacterium]|nr:hypothetical protein [Ignavibacteriales bacterium]
MGRPRWLILILLVASSGVLVGQEEGPDVLSGKERKLEWSGNFDAKYALFHMDAFSPFYTLQFLAERPSSSFLTQYRLEPYLNAEYRTSDLSFVLKTHATYYNDADARVDLFEAYGSFSPSFNTTLQAGKRVYNWGKGYAFNPVGFVNSIKDPENPELAQAGLLSANIEYIKSLQSRALQSVALTAVLLPSPTALNSRYGEVASMDLALKTYFLIWDMDIDLMTYQSKDKPRSYGVDFARNLRENVEIHGEFSYAQNVQRHIIRDGLLANEQTEALSYLLGLRFLSASNTTIIAEYFHNGVGLGRREYEQYYGFVMNGSKSSNPAVMQQTLGTMQTYFRGSNTMKDYLYVKLIHPEPFDWLYFTPSMYSICNLTDKSFLLSVSLSYKPITNMEFIVWPTILVGGTTTEYGGKQIQERVELWMRVYY